MNNISFCFLNTYWVTYVVKPFETKRVILICLPVKRVVNRIGMQRVVSWIAYLDKTFCFILCIVTIK